MIEMRNSDLLDQIIEYAKTIGNTHKKAFTAERFIVSVIDVLDGVADIEITDKQKEKLTKLFSEYFFDFGVDFSEIKTLFIDNADEGSNESYEDALYIQRMVYNAKVLSKSKGLDLLTVDALLECIFKEPNGFIKLFINADSDTELGIKSFSEFCEKIDSTIETALLESDTPEIDTKSIESEEEITEKGKENAEAHKASAEDPKATVFALTEKVKNMHDQLSDIVMGQEHAIGVFTAGYFQSELLYMTDESRKRPRATFLFAGPPGVGKTFLAETAADILKSEYEFHRFDMSEYSDKDSALEFIGSDEVYKGSKTGNFTDFVSKHPKCFLLFDEIEKAHISIIHLFLQILDAGRIRDKNTDAEISLSDAIIVFTTNAGRQLYEDAESHDLSGIRRKVILKALQNDINPETNQPYFPSAICSRFASGNVVMFNHMAAHNLHAVARKEVIKHVSNFVKKFNIKVNLDERVYSALLFAEGGFADARTIRSRAEAFFNNEIFELFRLLDSDKANNKVNRLESISIGLELPKYNDEITALFNNKDGENVLLVSSESVFKKCKDGCPDITLINSNDIDSAKKSLTDKEIDFALIDIAFGRCKESKYLNVEDVESVSRNILRYIREYYSDLPIYLLLTNEKKLNDEERLSFLRQGVRGFITLTKSKGAFARELKEVVTVIHQQRSIEKLAKANKLISFETAQTISNNGKNAQIKLFDFEFAVAIDAEDSKSILSNVSKPNVCFEDVIGAEEAKKELQYFVDYLKNPKKYLGTGVSAPRGVLLYGPPGTGKTMLAKAMAHESDVTFIAAEGNQFLKQYQGQGAEKVHEIFRTARKYAPSILFIDEIDAIAKERTGRDSGDAEATLTTFLAEMDGFKNNAAKPVFVLAATNFDVEPGNPKSLDSAFMRRFDRRLYIDLPNRVERTRYIKEKVAQKKAFVVSEEKIENISLRSTGMSLAELESVLELSLRTAIRDGNLKVTDEIFEDAFETFNNGETEDRDAKSLERTARHEAGHAFLLWESGETPSYVTIVARGDHGGYMQHGDVEKKRVRTKKDMLTLIRTSLGGRAAEMVYYGEEDGLTTGAAADLINATNVAFNIICSHGMEKDFGLAVISSESARTGELSMKVREAANKILDEEMEKAIKLIAENRASIDALVEKLLYDNHLTGHEIVQVFEKHSVRTEN